MADNTYQAQYAPTGRSKCSYNPCKQFIDKDTVRLGKDHPSAFHDGLQTDWFHPLCIFKSFANARKGTKVVESSDDIEGFLKLKQEDKKAIEKLIQASASGDIKKNVMDERKKARELKKANAPPKDPKPKASPKKEKAGGHKVEKQEKITSMIKQKPQSPPRESWETILERQIPSPWRGKNGLSQFIKCLDGYTQLFESPYSGLFNPLQYTSPQSVKLVCIGGTKPKSMTESRFFHENLYSLIKFQKEVKATADEWFQNTAEQDVLWLYHLLHSELTDYLWVPILVKIVKMIIASKASSPCPSVVFSLFGEQTHKFEGVLVSYLLPVIKNVQIRILKFPDASVQSDDLDVFSHIDNALVEIGLEEIDWVKNFEYAICLKGASYENQDVSLELPKSNEDDGSFILGRNSFGDYEIKDNRISRSQLKLWPLTDPNRGELGCKVMVLGKNPIHYGSSLADQQVLQGGQAVEIRDGGYFTLILGGMKFSVVVIKKKLDGPQRTPVSLKRGNSFDRTPQQLQRSNSFDRSQPLQLRRSNSSDQPPQQLQRSNSFDKAPQTIKRANSFERSNSGGLSPSSFKSTSFTGDPTNNVTRTPSKLQLERSNSFKSNKMDVESPAKFQFDDSPPKAQRQESVNLEIKEEPEGGKVRKLPSWSLSPEETSKVKKIQKQKEEKAKPVKKEKKEKEKKEKKPKKETKTKKKSEAAPSKKRKQPTWEDSDDEIAPPKKKKKKKAGVTYSSDDSGDMADGGPEPRSDDDDWIVKDDAYDSDEENRLADEFDRSDNGGEDEKPVCMYGLKCYRTHNLQHLAQFDHPWLNGK